MAKILLVEDEVNIASFIKRGLMELGHEVTVAYDGEEGWNIARSDSFDFLILDIIMPKMNGLDMCAKYRSSYGYKTPVIMLTALGTLCTKSMFSRVNLMLHAHVFKSRNFVKNIRFSRVNLRKTRKVQICPKFPKNLQNLQISDISEKHENSVFFFQ
jgi:response regulator RpfG family c-di-GMP phosphodiesterase